MAQPTVLPEWATQDELDTIYNTSNKAIPSDEKQKWGQRGDKNTLRQDINYLFNKTREWIGTVYIAASTGGIVPADIDDLLGGTWQYIDGGAEPNGGGTTLAGEAVQVFEKIGM